MKWYECQGCGEEFRVVSDTNEPVSFCPFCSEPIEEDVDDEDEEYDEY